MKIRYLGHATFVVTTGDGIRIILDPYEPGGFGGQIAYGAYTEPVDVAVVSHDHADHNYVRGLKGNPAVVRGSRDQTVRGIEFRAIPVYHDARRGAERGENVIRVFTADGLTLCHVGDLGHTLTEDTVTQIGAVDILFLPVGGRFTIDAAAAAKVAEQIAPKVVIPMHFKTAKVDFGLAPVEDFLRGKEGRTQKLGVSEVEAVSDRLPAQRAIWALQPAL